MRNRCLELEAGVSGTAVIKGMAMTDNRKPKQALARRSFLQSAGALTASSAGIVAGAKTTLAASEPDPAITELKDWNQYLGYGVDAQAYGLPSSFEDGAIRRWVPWLTASADSSSMPVSAMWPI